MSVEAHLVGCIGLGTMGPGVAVDYLLGGHRVTLFGRDAAKLSTARHRVLAALDFLTGQDYLTAPQREEAQTRLSTAFLTDRASLSQMTIIAESISESVEAKAALFADLEEICSAQTLFLTNTSGLSISAIFADLGQPDRGLGTHYWNPPYLMPLVEVTPGQATGPAQLAAVEELLRAMGKTPVRVRREVPGLIWNRLQFALLRECLHLLEQGVATVAELDQVVEMGLARRASFMGLFKTADLGGGDVWHTIARNIFPHLSNDSTPPAFWQEQIERGEYGLKSGQGFYSWEAEAARDLLLARDRYLLSRLPKPLS